MCGLSPIAVLQVLHNKSDSLANQKPYHDDRRSIRKAKARDIFCALWTMILSHLLRVFSFCYCSTGQRYLSLDLRVFFFNTTRIFFDSHFKISTLVCSHDITLVFFHQGTYILQTSTHIFYCVLCILQVST